MLPTCRVATCRAELIVGQNWWKSRESKRDYICSNCAMEKVRNKHGYKVRAPDWGRKYGVPYILPNGDINPDWWTARDRAIGHKPMSNKYGIPCNLPDGRRNLEYDEAWRREHGRKPRAPDWGKKYGVPSLLPNGRPNPEYSTRLRRAKGMKPIEAWYNRGSKYGVPTHLSDGKRNPEWYKRYYRSPEGRNSIEKSLSKRRFLYPLKTVWGNPFKGSHLHHMTKDTGVYIPEALHRSIPHCLETGKNMDKINAEAMKWYEHNNPKI